MSYVRIQVRRKTFHAHVALEALRHPFPLVGPFEKNSARVTAAQTAKARRRREPRGELFFFFSKNQ